GKADEVGARGEAIAYARLTEAFQKNGRSYFLPHFLGDKCPTFDYLVELVGAGRRQLFFFAQIKATRAGYTTATPPPRLKARIKASDVRRMSLSPAPTYVIAVDEPAERAFVVCVYGDMADAISSITTAHELNGPTLRRLWDEVREYWRHRNMRRKT